MKALILALYLLAALLEGGAVLLAYRNSGMAEQPPGSGLYGIPKKFVAGTVLAASGVVVAVLGNALSLTLD